MRLDMKSLTTLIVDPETNPRLPESGGVLAAEVVLDLTCGDTTETRIVQVVVADSSRADWQSDLVPGDPNKRGSSGGPDDSVQP